MDTIFDEVSSFTALMAKVVETREWDWRGVVF